MSWKPACSARRSRNTICMQNAMLKKKPTSRTAPGQWRMTIVQRDTAFSCVGGSGLGGFGNLTNNMPSAAARAQTAVAVKNIRNGAMVVLSPENTQSPSVGPISMPVKPAIPMLPMLSALRAGGAS